MKLNTFLILAAVVYAFFGLAVLFVPVEFTAYFGVNLNPGGVLLGRILGAALIAFALVCWWSQKEANRGALRSFLHANAIYNAIGIVIGVHAIQNGIVNVNAWMPVIAHAVLLAGFGYFGFMKKR